MTTKRYFTGLVARALLLLALTFGAFAPATAQPAVSDEDVTLMAESVRSLTDPGSTARLTEAQWNAYGENLERALASGHEGLCQGALRMIIFYGDNLEISRVGVFDVVRIYRDHKDDRMRRMAAVALGRIQDPWGMDFLERSVRFEKTPGVRHTVQAVLAEHRQVDPGPSKVRS